MFHIQEGVFSCNKCSVLSIINLAYTNHKYYRNLRDCLPYLFSYFGVILTVNSFLVFSRLNRRLPIQAGLVIDPKNSGLEASLAATKEAQEVDRRERWRRAAGERDAEKERLKMRDAAKARASEAKAEASEAKAGAVAASAGETNAAGDPLSSFFSELQGERNNAPPQKVERVLHEKYTEQDLGTPKEQMDRLLQHNYKWKNLNAFDALQLGHDATFEDIKQRLDR